MQRSGEDVGHCLSALAQACPQASHRKEFLREGWSLLLEGLLPSLRFAGPSSVLAFQTGAKRLPPGESLFSAHFLHPWQLSSVLEPTHLPQGREVVLHRSENAVADFLPPPDQPHDLKEDFLEPNLKDLLPVEPPEDEALLNSFGVCQGLLREGGEFFLHGPGYVALCDLWLILLLYLEAVQITIVFGVEAVYWRVFNKVKLFLHFFFLFNFTHYFPMLFFLTIIIFKCMRWNISRFFVIQKVCLHREILGGGWKIILAHRNNKIDLFNLFHS